ncbi:MAG: hypothetical protein GXY77_01710 [Fibrobacter sp.]|nr:hypothetical protein [Fibrobacter sp.]
MFRHAVFCYSLIAVLLCLSCGNPASEGGVCKGPTINSCSGDICTYAHIFDADGNFVNEISASGIGNLQWNGTDCNGDSVPCGKYMVTMHIMYNGNHQTISDIMLVTGHNGNSSSGSGDTECDSLEVNCQGTYSETLSDFGDRRCICCQ